MNNQNWHALSVGEVIRILETNVLEGLTEKEVRIRQEKFGKNLLPEEKSPSVFRLFFEQFRSPLIYILVIAAIVTLILKDYSDAIIIFGAVFLNTIIGFFQESKTSKILTELKKIVKIKAYVIREGNEKEIEQQELVPGDFFLLSAGNKVPADGRLIEVHDLKINESSLTGEWLAAEKNINILPEKTSLADRDNMVYMGTIAEEGRGRAIVTGIGSQTEIGKIAVMIRETREEKTPYQKKLAHFSKIVGIIISLICLVIFIEGIITGGKFVEMFTIAVAVAVAAIPEGLPVAMTVILALGMQRILKKKGLVRKMIAAETLGSTSIICTDKTGTLTEGKMKVSEIIGDKSLALKTAILTSEAFIENPDEPKDQWIIRGRPTEKALLIAGIEAGLNKKVLEKSEPEIDRLPFDPVYKYSVTLRKFSEQEAILYILGAPEIILAMSKYFNFERKEEILPARQRTARPPASSLAGEVGREPQALAGGSEEKINTLKRKFEDLAGKGQRVLATAYKILRITNLNELRIENEIKDLIFVGLIGLHDPLRPEVKEAIKICREAGMKSIIVTGDHKLTAKAIAEEFGLPAEEENIIEGKDLEEMSDETFQKILDKIEIYSRVEPKHKTRIVDAWQDRGEIVAMTGDGINDAPALKKADIGVALGSGTEVAKEASDLILLNDSFSIIVAAVEEGRVIIDNIRKVITYLLSDSFTEIILIGGSMLVAWLTKISWVLPITAVQILWVNLIEDGLPDIALAFEPKEKDIMQQKPTGHEIPLLTREMKTLILIFGLVTDFLLLGLFFWLLKYSGYEISHIRSIIFAGLAIDSLFYVFSCKSLRRNLWQINLFSNKFLVVNWFFGIVMLFTAFYLPPLQMLLKVVPLNLFDWQLILGLGFLNLILIEVTKWYFITKSSKHSNI